MRRVGYLNCYGLRCLAALLLMFSVGLGCLGWATAGLREEAGENRGLGWHCGSATVLLVGLLVDSPRLRLLGQEKALQWLAPWMVDENQELRAGSVLIDLSGPDSNFPLSVSCLCLGGLRIYLPTCVSGQSYMAPRISAPLTERG